MRRYGNPLVTLGLLLCVVHVRSDLTCGTEFTDVASSAILADIIIEGRVKDVPDHGERYNATIQVRSVKKGSELLNGGKKPRHLIIGSFGQENKQDCIGHIEKKKKYLFFLRTPRNGGKYLQLAALPARAQKKIKRTVKKILCKGCAKAPEIRKVKNKKVQEGKGFKLKCSVKAKPNAKFQWFKDGIALPNRKDRLRITGSRKTSRLKVTKARSTDGGEYVCSAYNAVDRANITVKVTVKKDDSNHQRCEQQTYCLNGGTCRYIESINQEFCECPESWDGKRCELQDIFSLNPVYNREGQLLHERTIIFISIAIATLVFIAICILSYFLARRQRKKWKARMSRRKNKNIPEASHSLLDNPDGPQRSAIRTRETTVDYSHSDNYTSYVDPNVYPVINPHYEAPKMEPVEMRHARPVGASPSVSSQGPDRRSRTSSRGSRSRLKAVSLDEGRDNEEVDQPGMDEPDCMAMREMPRNCFSDGNIKGSDRNRNTKPLPTSMQNTDIPEKDMDDVEPLDADDPAAMDLDQLLKSMLGSEKEDAEKSTDGAPSDYVDSATKQPCEENLPEPHYKPRGLSLDFSDSEEEDHTEESPLTMLHISEDEAEHFLETPKDKSFDSVDLTKSDSQPTPEDVPENRGPVHGVAVLKQNSDSFSSSPTGSPDTHPSSSMENIEIPVLPNGTETGLSWDEHGMPVSPGHYNYPPHINTDSQNLDDQFIQTQPPNELPLSPTRNNAMYQKFLKDIREDQDAIPI